METAATTRECPKCKRELPLSAFSRNKASKSGVQVYCKECIRQYNAAHRQRAHTKNTPPDISCTDAESPFASMMPREIIGEIKERINYLRSTGWVFEGKLEYTQVRTIKL